MCEEWQWTVLGSAESPVECNAVQWRANPTAQHAQQWSPKKMPGLGLRLKGYDYAKIKQKMAKQLKKTKIPGLGRGGLAWPESESARNFMDKCVYEKCSAKKKKK